MALNETDLLKDALLAFGGGNEGDDIPLDELAERLEATQAYAGEDPDHFIEYCHACVEESTKASEDIRLQWEELWEAYQLNVDYSDKEDWQAKTITPDPFMAVQQAKALVRKAFRNPEYYTVNGVEWGDEIIAKVVKTGLDYWLNYQHARFPVNFCDATEMSFAIGLSHEMIPRWDNERGLVIDLVEPWKIYRDPDARARDPWSGMYCIHEEWQDLWQLKEGEAAGIYQNVENLSEETGKAAYDKEKMERRKGQYWSRSRYRKGVLTREFRGAVLGKDNNLLLPNAVFTVAGDEIIRPPVVSPYVKIKWPGSSFSPYAHLLRYEGRGLIENVISLWWVMNNVFNLQLDGLNWYINKLREYDPSLWADGTDMEIYPGASKALKPGSMGPSIRAIEEKSTVPDTMAVVQAIQQKWDNGSGVNQFVAGLPGTRSNITLGETQIKTQQSLGLFDSIGEDVEYGALNLIYACYETIMLNWTGTSIPSPSRVLGETDQQAAMMFERIPIEERKAWLKEGADITVSGIAAQMRQQENAEMFQTFMKLASAQPFAPFIKPYELLLDGAEVMGNPSPRYIVTPEEAEAVKEAIAAQNEADRLLKQQQEQSTLTPEVTSA